MNLQKQVFTIVLSIIFSLSIQSQELETENVFLITLDGLRWQELFGGADSMLISNTNFVKDTAELESLFWRENGDERRQALLPFVWDKIAKEGQIYGNRNYGNKMNCSNRFWFSYPGYNEILTGYSDPNISSNSKTYNPNKTVLEVLNNKEELNGKVAAFASWDVFPFIINDKRSKIPTNAGFQMAEGQKISKAEAYLNKLQPTVPSPWSTVRLDAFTHNYALEYIKRKSPRLVYIAYGETDDFAHDGSYDHYLKSAKQTDQWIQELWNYAQLTEQYAGKTTFVITTDHGRGAYPNPIGEWKGHGTTIDGSNAIWLMAIGPDTKALGEVKNDDQLWQNQIAQTVAKLMGYEYTGDRYECGKAITTIYSSN